jgi:hypothetical protein
MGKLVYGILAYVGFLCVYLWLVAFLGDFAVAKTVDSGDTPSTSLALAGSEARYRHLLTPMDDSAIACQVSSLTVPTEVG